MITPLMEKAYWADCGERIKAEILESNERERAWKASLVEIDKTLPEYERPIKVGWSPPRKKVSLIRLVTQFIP